MGQRHILHCDCNCFYASVEMQEHPELRGKSIAVCGDPEARHGIVLTASYPAKRMGVKTGMPIWEAKQHCRDLIIVPASYGKYQKYSGYVREVFNLLAAGNIPAKLDLRTTAQAATFGFTVSIAPDKYAVRMVLEARLIQDSLLLADRQHVGVDAALAKIGSSCVVVLIRLRQPEFLCRFFLGRG